MNAFDLAILEFLNQFARTSVRVDQTIMFVSGSHLLKGGVLMSFFWWLWFSARDRQQEVRAHLGATLVASIAAIIIARGLTSLLPFRHRPMQEPGLDLTLPWGVPEDWWDGWTSFPSDHAVLFFALATGIWFASRRAGWLAVIYVIFAISLPRVYLGFHYATDIIGGAFAGIAVCIVFNLEHIRRAIDQATRRLLVIHPGIVYAFLFLLSYQIAVLFDDIRHILSFMSRMAPF